MDIADKYFITVRSLLTYHCGLKSTSLNISLHLKEQNKNKKNVFVAIENIQLTSAITKKIPLTFFTKKLLHIARLFKAEVCFSKMSENVKCAKVVSEKPEVKITSVTDNDPKVHKMLNLRVKKRMYLLTALLYCFVEMGHRICCFTDQLQHI